MWLGLTILVEHLVSPVKVKAVGSQTALTVTGKEYYWGVMEMFGFKQLLQWKALASKSLTLTDSHSKFMQYWCGWLKNPGMDRK